MGLHRTSVGGVEADDAGTQVRSAGGGADDVAQGVAEDAAAVAHRFGRCHAQQGYGGCTTSVVSLAHARILASQRGRWEER